MSLKGTVFFLDFYCVKIIFYILCAILISKNYQKDNHNA